MQCKITYTYVRCEYENTYVCFGTSAFYFKQLFRRGCLTFILQNLNDTEHWIQTHTFSWRVRAYNFKKISHYKKIGYNINVLQQIACFVVNQITVDNFAFLFNCTPVGRTSDSKRLIYWWDGRGLMLRLLSGPLGFTCWISLLQYSVFCTV